MTRKPPPGHTRSLSKEDQAIWESTAASLEPLKRKSARIHPSAERGSDERAADAGRRPIKPGSTRVETVAPQPRAPAKVPELNPFDPKAARRLRKGQAEIDARIDLHGMRQSEAHAALRRFLHSAFARGYRWVLVITGKGASSRRSEAADWDVGAERGVLKRNVPVWLAQADLRAIIVSYTTASAAHGGEGALYVHLRNPERMRGR